MSALPMPQPTQAARSLARLHGLLKQVIDATQEMQDQQSRGLAFLIPDQEERQRLLDEVLPFLLTATNFAEAAMECSARIPFWRVLHQTPAEAI